MAKPQLSLPLLFMVAFLSVQHSNQAELSQSQVILKIQQFLSFTNTTTTTTTTATDFCNTEPTQSLTLVCYEGDITQLHITGNKAFSSLPQSFSTHSLFASLVKLSSLKVLTLASLGLWGPMPGSIGHLASLEILNVSSNHFSGDIPVQLIHLRNLHTLILDHNSFSGKVPFWLNVLPMLTVLSLSNNSLTGSLPNSLGSLRNLRVLTLSENNLSGEVPNLKKLTNLQALDLKGNNFGPHFPSLPRKIVTLVLRNNRFHLGIPDKLTSFYLLQKLDISLNGFVGPFLPSLLSLPSITYLDISGNKLTGALLENMPCNTDLVFVNLSSNYFVGKLPSCLKLGPRDTRAVLYSGNCLSSDGNNQEEQKQNPSEFCHKEALAVEVIPHRERNKVQKNKPVLASGLAGGIVGVIVVVGLVSLLVKKLYGKGNLRKPSTRLITEYVSTVNTAKLLSNAKYISETMKMGAALPAYRTFALEDLKEATNNFDTSTLLGETSNGQMYRGKLSDGTLVAIRSLKMRKKRSPHAYTHHLEMISKLRHCHLVSALGHCLECHLDDTSVSRIFLVFEFAPNGTLRDCVSVPQGKKLNWAQRISAAIGVTKGVQFLHTGIVPGVYSNNLKITNVLMDHDLHPKISSYNLPLLVENTATSNVVYPYASKGSALERVNHEDKNDVYDIGVILLELILGRPVMFHNEVGSLKDLLRVSITTDDDTGRRSIVDPAVHKQCSDESLKTMMEVCVRCLSAEPAERPSVEDILWTLQFAAQVQGSGRGDSVHSTEALMSQS